MRKGFGTLMALAAGAFVIGAQVSVAEAAPFGKPAVVFGHGANLVKVHDRGYKHRGYRHRGNAHSCRYLRRKAMRTGSRRAWVQFKICQARRHH